MAKLSLRIDVDGGGRLGPGKVALLEAIDREGSISAAGRRLDMSYRRAWTLIEELNTIFGRPVLEITIGGKAGGGAALSPLGRAVVETYRRIEATAAETSAADLALIESLCAKPG